MRESVIAYNPHNLKCQGKMLSCKVELEIVRSGINLDHAYRSNARVGKASETKSHSGEFSNSTSALNHHRPDPFYASSRGYHCIVKVSSDKSEVYENRTLTQTAESNSPPHPSPNPPHKRRNPPRSSQPSNAPHAPHSHSPSSPPRSAQAAPSSRAVLAPTRSLAAAPTSLSRSWVGSPPRG